MPKLSYAQEVAALEETLAAVRRHAEVLPPLALAVADELEAQIAEIKALKERQRFYAAEGRIATAALHAGIARGSVYARSIRCCAVFLYGHKDARVVGFGVQLHRRPRRGVGDPAGVSVDRSGPVVEASAGSPDAAWTAHAGRANADALGVDIQEVGGKAAWGGGNATARRGNAVSERAEGQPLGAFDAGGGAPASDRGGKALEPRGNSQDAGGNLMAAA